jgi:hypothetical protein
MRALCPVLLVLVACAPTGTGPGITGPTADQELDALLSRDLDTLPESRPVVGPAGLFVARVPASAEPSVRSIAGAAQIAWSLGTQELVQCVLFGQRMNVADVLSTTLSEVYSRFSTSDLERIDAGELGGEPYLAVDVLYRVDSGGRTGVGELKILAVSHHAVTLVCTHDEPGYRRAFCDAVLAFTRTLVVMTDSDRPPSLYRAIHVIQVGEARVGFLDTWVEKLQGDEVTQSSSLALLSTRADGRISSLDVDTYEVSDEADRLLEARYVSTEDHVERANLELNQRDSKTYTVRGSHNGKQVRAELRPPEGLLGDYGQGRLAAAKLAAGVAAWSAPTFDSLNPDNVLETTFTQSGADADGSPLVLVRQGDRLLRIAFDAHGHELRLNLVAADGRTPMTFRRVWVTGEPAER